VEHISQKETHKSKATNIVRNSIKRKKGERKKQIKRKELSFTGGLNTRAKIGEVGDRVFSYVEVVVPQQLSHSTACGGCERTSMENGRWWASFGGQRRPNRVRLREIGRMAAAVEALDGVGRRCLVGEGRGEIGGIGSTSKVNKVKVALGNYCTVANLYCTTYALCFKERREKKKKKEEQKLCWCYLRLKPLSFSHVILDS
jgi:hypothetical protein